MHFDFQPTVPSVIRLALGIITFLTKSGMILLFSSLREKNRDADQIRRRKRASGYRREDTQEGDKRTSTGQQTPCRLLVLANHLLLFVEDLPLRVSTSIALTVLVNIASIVMFLSSSVQTNPSDAFTQTQDDIIVLIIVTSGIMEPLASSPDSDEPETDEERHYHRIHICQCVIWKGYQTEKKMEQEYDKENNAILSKFGNLMLAEDIFPTITHTIEQFMATSQPSLSLTRTLTSVVTVLCNLTAHRNVVTSLHAKFEKSIEMLVGVEYMVQEMHDDFDDDSSNASHDDLEELLKAIEGANLDHLELGDGLYEELKPNSTLTNTVTFGFSLNQTAMAPAHLTAADSQAMKMGEMLSSRVWICILSIMSAD
ncbi:hypothetical protein BLNAU_19722 [Blattamonas nauphoetae]|uniref:Uncharacterized protein n=1 Tax=Blattamonas nauphoetae TaxID=2049346 RepID=A0ABQ9X164_9EUKA|nr:hypothetical protein BLNAU_19722 [Blattamonas nauphoetae]